MDRAHGMKCWRRFLFVALASPIAAISLACSGSSNDPSKGQLSGTITYQGKPLPGFIVVESEDKSQRAMGSFKPDGSYEIKDVPLGIVKVGFGRRPIRLPGRPEAQDAGGKAVAIPAKYKDPSKSGLTVEIHQGKNTYSVDLP